MANPHVLSWGLTSRPLHNLTRDPLHILIVIGALACNVIPHSVATPRGLINAESGVSKLETVVIEFGSAISADFRIWRFVREQGISKNY